MTGLSPRVRGSLDAIAARSRRAGSIPACAGKPGSRGRCRCNFGVYPRVCGEAPRPVFRARREHGLSPRVRGSHAGRRVPRCYRGSIPACAGKPYELLREREIRWVYPRVCGEARLCARVCRCGTGLSPRVRGSRIAGPRGRDRTGSIPACAGKPLPGPLPQQIEWVYPRVCGEAECVGMVQTLRRGLSPRVRGSRVRGDGPDVAEGSIPACAGKPPSRCPTPHPAWVYPRVCGEATVVELENSTDSGLSPRVRGSRVAEWIDHSNRGSIPACAGKPRDSRRRSTELRVYPRVCGEACSVLVGGSVGSGLSPRVRGSRRIDYAERIGRGSIPACAGKPGSCSARR